MSSRSSSLQPVKHDAKYLLVRIISEQEAPCCISSSTVIKTAICTIANCLSRANGLAAACALRLEGFGPQRSCRAAGVWIKVARFSNTTSAGWKLPFPALCGLPVEFLSSPVNGKREIIEHSDFLWTGFKKGINKLELRLRNCFLSEWQMCIHLLSCVLVIYLEEEISLLTQSFSVLRLDNSCTSCDFTHCVF